MIDYEKLGVFYLGKLLDPGTKKVTDDLYLYDSKDLTTHAVCIGMTGSGKTGLCVTLLEEAAIDGVPAIAIDPKGDIANILLAFPNLSAEEFRPWIDPAEAGRQGMTPEEFAQVTAQKWKDGIAEWHQDPARVQKLRDAAEMAIYTPGSSAGVPISVLRSLSAPPANMMQDADAVRQRISSDVAGLLALLGMPSDSLESREHILISTIIDRAWKAGQDVQIPALLRQIQAPPFDKVGFLDLESFFPSTERFALVTRLNNLFASPAFAGWMEGEPLDIGRLLYTPRGKPRIAILSIAHLSDSERMFFVTILLNEVLAWMRSQPGTSSLRALLYMDEIFGYFPPTANPPSKMPMLTLLKQARAYGLGVVLATQNPVDLDYKGMANTGTWFIGRLQTDRDKMRVLDGLEGASTSAGFSFDRAKIDSTLSGLVGRTFLVNNVHEDAPVLMQTRWALSYLRGPLTKEQIQRLMANRSAEEAKSDAPKPAARKQTVPAQAVASGGDRPMIPPGIEEIFLPHSKNDRSGRLVYVPGLLGIGQAHYVNAKAGVDCWEKDFVLQVVRDSLPHPAWEGAKIARDCELELEKQPEPDIAFAAIPADLSIPKNYQAWTTELKQYLYQQLSLKLWTCAATKEQSTAKESEGDFRVRVRQTLTERRDQQIEKIRKKYAPKFARLEERIRKAEQRIQKEKTQQTQSTLQMALSIGSSLLGALLGRKKMSVQNVQRATSSARAAGRVLSEKGDVDRAEDDLATLQEEMKNLDAQLTEETDKIKEDCPIEDIELTEVSVRPRKADLAVTKIALVWTPWSMDSQGAAEPAFDFGDP